MFDKLATLAILSYNTQHDDVKMWQTKEASDKFDTDAYLAGFKGSFIKEASEAPYVAASELGTCVGLALLESLRSAK